MDILKIKAEEARGFDAGKCREVELDIRRELNKIRLDVYANHAANSTRSKQLRKSLARIKTVVSERKKNDVSEKKA